jgi:8-oxo-dGTP diphosphatase
MIVGMNTGGESMPKATVAAIVTNSASQILLTRRNIEPYKDHWCLPGGHIDPYETVTSAVVREVKEETGLDFDAHYCGYSDEIIPDRGLHAVVLVFTGRGSGTLQRQEVEVTEMRWFTLDEARALPLAFTHNQILAAYPPFS